MFAYHRLLYLYLLLRLILILWRAVCYMLHQHKLVKRNERYVKYEKIVIVGYYFDRLSFLLGSLTNRHVTLCLENITNRPGHLCSATVLPF